MATMTRRSRHAGDVRRDLLVELLALRGATLRDHHLMLRDRQRSGPMDDEDRALDAEEQDVGISLLELSSRTVRSIEAALLHLEEGDYGTCGDCGSRIPEARLRALPSAARCCGCQADHDAASLTRGGSWGH